MVWDEDVEKESEREGKERSDKISKRKTERR